MPRDATSVATQTLATAIAQGLQRLVALVLAVLARERHGAEAALDQAGVKMADIVARGAKQHRRLRLVEAQQIDDGILDVCRCDSHRLIVDVAMATLGLDRRDAQRVALIAPGERDDRRGHGRGEQERAALGRRRVENLLKVFAKAHVEHLVGFIEHDGLQGRKVERPAFEMIAQAPGRPDHDLRAMTQRAPFLGGVHAADAGRDARAGLAVEPDELAADLKRQLARGRDDEGQRPGRGRHAPIGAEQIARHGETEGDRLAGSGLRRDDEIATMGLVLEHGGLHRVGAA